MGCICSKDIARSMSIREEFSQGFKSRSAVWEGLLTSHSGKDPSVNINTAKLNSSSFTPVDAWDLVEEINAKAEGETRPDVADGQQVSWRFTRSKSCHTLREKETISENSLQYSGKNMAGSRSFHTVEEYDALLERIHGSRSLESFEDCFPWDDDKLQKSTSLSEDEYETMCRDGEGVNVGEKRETQEGKVETGWKRKAVARGLKTLDISTAELSSIARIKQRMLVHEQIYSPETYITPKFGSYNAPAIREKESDEDMTFSPELIAAFEDCVKQIQVEEETILRHMDEMENHVAIP